MSVVDSGVLPLPPGVTPRFERIARFAPWVGLAREALPAPGGAVEALEIALAPILTGDLALLTVTDLKRLCKGAGLNGYSKYKKVELVSLLKASGIAAPPLQVKKLSRAQLETIASAALATRAMG